MPIPTPFHERTAALCTSLRFKAWAGYFAVQSYEVHHEPEYLAFRNTAGLLDISPLYKYIVAGSDAAAFLAFVMARDVRKLGPGRVGYSCFCDAEGKVIDDGTIACLDEGRYRVTTASPAYRWLDLHSRGFRVEIEDRSAAIAALALQGPSSRAVLRAVIGAGIDGLGFFRTAPARVGRVEVDVSRTGYTGDLGYELWMPAASAVPVWDALIEAGKPFGLLPAGLDALDVTRIEAGFILQDVDYFSAPRCMIESRKSSPFEIGLGWTVALEREPFVGQRALRAERARGSPWQMVGLDMSWAELEALYDGYRLPPALPAQASRAAVPVYDGRRQVGQATSSAWSPILKRYLALASVVSSRAAPGTRLSIEHTVEYERRTIGATVVERPFFDPERKRS